MYIPMHIHELHDRQIKALIKDAIPDLKEDLLPDVITLVRTKAHLRVIQEKILILEVAVVTGEIAELMPNKMGFSRITKFKTGAQTDLETQRAKQAELQLSLDNLSVSDEIQLMLSSYFLFP